MRQSMCTELSNETEEVGNFLSGRAGLVVKMLRRRGVGVPTHARQNCLQVFFKFIQSFWREKHVCQKCNGSIE